MFKHKILAVIIIGLLSCSLMVLAASSASMAKNEKSLAQEPKQSQGGGCINCNDVNGNISEQTDSKSNSVQTVRRTMGANRHVMAAPEKFPKDGVYIWCDPDGLWTMFWKGKQSFTVNAIVSAGKPITVTAAVKATASTVGVNQLKIASTSKARVGIVQFTSASDSVQFNILINGQYNPNRVYIGSRLSCPTQFPLKLSTRRTFTQEGTLETKITIRKQSREPVMNVSSNKTPAWATRPSTNKGGGGSQGGAKRKSPK